MSLSPGVSAGRSETAPGISAVAHSTGEDVPQGLPPHRLVLALRNWREARGEQMQADMRQLIGQVRAVLIGHKPAAAGARVIGWQSGKVLDYDASVLLFADVYQMHHVMHRDEVAPCPPRA